VKKIFIYVVLLAGSLGCTSVSPNTERIQEELNLITSRTITIDVNSHTQEKYPLSKLIDSVRYVVLENTDEALIAQVRNIKVINDLIYVLDLQQERLKCFDRRSGKFIRNACKWGNGPEEVAHLIDFDVDENYLYVLDGAKVAIHKFSHDGIYIDKMNLPFRVQKFSCFPNEGYLFELAPFGLDNNRNNHLVVYTDLHYRPVQYLLRYITGAFTGISFENRQCPTYLYSMYGNGIYEKMDSTIFMKYYIDFGGKYFNANKNEDGFKQAVEQKIYFTSNAPVHNENYLLQGYSAGMKREGTLFVCLRNNRSMFIENLIQDRNDLIDFNFSYTMGYDETNQEFYGVCNYIDVANIHSDDKDKIMEGIRNIIPQKIQPFLIQNNADKNMNQILVFYKLKNNIDI
jgi:hypothetical protein